MWRLLIAVGFFAGHTSATHSSAGLRRSRSLNAKGAQEALAPREDSANHSRAALPVSLKVIAEQCRCSFVGLCTCGAAMEFMDCIADACATGGCDCGETHFSGACSSMLTTCPSSGMTCEEDKASCMHNPVLKREPKESIMMGLERLMERKRKLEKASKAGFINADRRLKELEPEIQAHYDALALYEPDPAPSPAPAFPGTPRMVAPMVAPGLVKANKPRHVIMLSTLAVYILLFVLCAIIYNCVRMKVQFPQEAGTVARGQFRFGLLSCLQDLKLSALACCCLGIRWADTLDKVDNRDNGGLLSYWTGILVTVGLMFGYGMLTLVALYPFAGSVFILAYIVIAVGFRQQLRRRVDIPAGTPRTYAEDCLAWCFCPCCAAVQEAREVEALRPTAVLPAHVHNSGQ